MLTFRHIIDAIFPPHRHTAAAHNMTGEMIERLYNLQKIEHTYIALPYGDERVRAIIKANKFYGDTHAAQLLGDTLNQTLLDIVEELILLPEWNNPVLVPIPSSSQRKRERGYNQVEKIIEKIPKETRNLCNYQTQLLKRHHRESQARIPKTKRVENMKEVFYVPEKSIDLISGKYVVLIDDVVESGATLAGATRALRKAGARDVLCIALAH